MPNYAQLNDSNIVFSVQYSKKEMDNTRFIRIPENDMSLIGQLYQDGIFIPINYFAVLEEGIVKEIITYPESVPIPLNTDIVQISQVESYSLIGTKYVDGKFVQPDPQQDQISALTDKVNGMTQALEDLICMYKNDKQTLYYRLKEKIKKQLKIKEKNGDTHL